MIDVSGGGESAEDGQKVVVGNTEVRNRGSGVTYICTIRPRRKEKMRG